MDKQNNNQTIDNKVTRDQRLEDRGKSFLIDAAHINNQTHYSKSNKTTEIQKEKDILTKHFPRMDVDEYDNKQIQELFEGLIRTYTQKYFSKE